MCWSEDSLFDAIWYWHILHRDQLCQVGQAVNILDFLTEFGAVKRREMVKIWRRVLASLNRVVTVTSDLMKGLVSARRVRMNQEGWTIIRDFRFFLNLRRNGDTSCQSSAWPPDLRVSSPPIDLLVALPQPAHGRHPLPRRGPVQVDDHVVLGHQ